MQTVKPSADYVFAKPEEKVTKTASGFLLSEQAAERPKMAEVINVGPDVKHLKPKDKFFYKPYATVDLKLNGDDYLMLKEEDIVGTVLEVKE